MESDVIEIAGEDDSLLPPLPKIPNDDVSTLNKTFFSCSPLQLPRSGRQVKPPVFPRTPAAKLTGNEYEEKLDSLSHRGGVNKENINMNKPEVPKLNMEPHQMKRKKKGGGYNLRKSLAWDRAFFTEEGVLDPLELSMISGSFGKSSGEMLSVIHEDRRDSLLSGDSEKLVALEENLFKELPSSTTNEDRKSSRALLPPSAGVNVASASAAKRKVISANDINRSGSKRSELKVSKVSVPKPDASVISATTKSKILCTSSSKQNQITQRAVNAERNIGLKGSLNNSKSAQNNAKSGFASKSMAAKSSAQPASRNVVSSVSKVHSSTNSQHPPVTKANKGLKTNPGPELPASVHASNKVDGGSSKYEISLPQNVPRSAGSLQYAQPKTTKPSGLRMPSPSLGFFNQSKASASHSVLQRSNQACNLEPSIPNLRKFGALSTINERPIPAPGKIDDMVNNVALSSKLRPPGPITGSSVPSNVKLDSHGKMTSKLHIDEMQKVCMSVTSNCNSSDILNQQKLHNLCNDIEQQSEQHAEPRKTEKISQVGDNELKSNDNKLLLQSAPCDQVMEDEDNERVSSVYPMNTFLNGAELENPDCTSHLCPTMQVDGVFETSDMVDDECIEGKICDSSIKSHGVFAESLYVESCVPVVNEQSKEQADSEKPYTCQHGQISNQSPRLDNDILTMESGSFSDFQKCNNVLIADASPEIKCCSFSELESCHCPFQSKNTEEAKDSVAGVDIFSTKSQVRDGEVQSVGGIVSVGNINKILCFPALDSRHITVVDDASRVIIDAGGSKSNGFSVPSSISPAVEDCSFDVAKTAQFLHGDDALSSSIDAKFSYDIKLHGQTTSGESDLMHEDQITAAVTTGDVQLSNVSDSGDFSGCGLENLQHLTSQHSAVVQPEVNDVIAAVQVNGDSDINEHKDMEDGQYNLLQNSHCSNSDLSPDTACCQPSTSIVHNDGLAFMHIVNSQYEEGNELLFNRSIIFEKSRKFDIENIADISPDVKNPSESGSKSCHVLFKHENTEQTYEEIAGVDNTNKKSLMEDARIQTVDGDLSVDSCNSNLNASAVKNMSSVCVDGVNEQSGVHTDPASVSAQGSLDSRAFCLNEKLTIKNFSSEESQERNVCASSMDVESTSIVWTHVTPALKNGGILEKRELAYPSEVSDSFDIKTSVENPKCYTDTKFRHDDDEFNHAYSMGFDASPDMSNCQILGVAKSCNSEENNLSSVQNIEVNISKRDVLSEEVERSNGSPNHEMQHELEGGMYAAEDNDGSVLKDMKFNEYKSDVLPEEAKTTTLQKIGGPNSDMKHELEDTICAADENDETKLIKNSWNDRKKSDLVIKPPPYAVPFSDEWLAALEAAGEEILTKKSGAVQNSPPEKSLPEPGPYSPVKRKNNQGIGPFDCTKYTNGNVNNIPPSDSN
ncbi:hypothetical protein ACOSQ3_016663 [Xanthoceras sorbifolium]